LATNAAQGIGHGEGAAQAEPEISDRELNRRTLKMPRKERRQSLGQPCAEKKKKKKKNKVYESRAETEGPHLVREGKKGNVACS
jgi:hypothetical protein